MVSGTLLINTLSTRVLFDADAAHSFINPTTAKRLTRKLDEMDIQLCVTTQVGLIHQTEAIVKGCPIVVHDRVFPTDLALLKIQGYDLILGID